MEAYSFYFTLFASIYILVSISIIRFEQNYILGKIKYESYNCIFRYKKINNISNVRIESIYEIHVSIVVTIFISSFVSGLLIFVYPLVFINYSMISCSHGFVVEPSSVISIKMLIIIFILIVPIAIIIFTYSKIFWIVRNYFIFKRWNNLILCHYQYRLKHHENDWLCLVEDCHCERKLKKSLFWGYLQF